VLANGVTAVLGMPQRKLFVHHVDAVSAIFATLRTIDMKQRGVGLAVAVLIDATVIRAVPLPAAMKPLGDWNWYLPRWLEWLPSLSAEGATEKESPEAPGVPATN